MKFFVVLLLLAAPMWPSHAKLISKEVCVEVDKAQIFCRVFGNGDPLIVIHGGPGLTQDYLLPEMARLGQNNLAIFYDQRGCGLSSGEVNPDSIQIKVFVEDLETIRKAFGFEKIALLGHSWGGFLAMQYAIAYPQSVDKLILLNSISAASSEFSLFIEEWMRRIEPYQAEIQAIKETTAFAEGDPEAIGNYYRILFRTYCFNPQKADCLNLYMSPKAGCVEKVRERSC